jgi:hypothetical protein
MLQGVKRDAEVERRMGRLRRSAQSWADLAPTMAKAWT